MHTQVLFLENSPHFILHIAPVVRAAATTLLLALLVAAVDRQLKMSNDFTKLTSVFSNKNLSLSSPL